MKDLFLVRHGEAEGFNVGMKDIDRPLTSVGKVDASRVGKLLTQRMTKPDLIISSTALRTRYTTDRIAEQLAYDPTHIDFKEELYQSSPRILLGIINAIDNTKKTVIIVAHNPVIPYLAEYLTGAVINSVQPAGVIHLQNEGLWADISGKNSRLISYFFPNKNV